VIRIPGPKRSRERTAAAPTFDPRMHPADPPLETLKLDSFAGLYRNRGDRIRTCDRPAPSRSDPGAPAAIRPLSSPRTPTAAKHPDPGDAADSMTSCAACSRLTWAASSTTATSSQPLDLKGGAATTPTQPHRRLFDSTPGLSRLPLGSPAGGPTSRQVHHQARQRNLTFARHPAREALPTSSRHSCSASTRQRWVSTEAVQEPARVKVRCVTPLGEEMASIS
jgi:hypothetical protein